MTKTSWVEGCGTIPAETRGLQKKEVLSQNLYRLKFVEENDRPGKEVEFEAEDAYQALVIAREEARRRAAELWLNGKKLCSIARQGGDFWEIRPAREGMEG